MSSVTYPSPARDFGVQSYCFREFKDNPTVARLVRETGLDKIEVCAVHADFNSPAAWKEIVRQYNDGGVSIISIGVQTFNGDDREEAWFECAATAGARHLSCHFQVDTYLHAIPKVRRWARAHDIRVGIHTHGGYMFGGSPDVMRHLIGLGSPEIGLCLDTAWALQIGPARGNPVDWARDFRGHVTGIHYKDFTFESNGQWQDTVVGEGNLDLSSLIRELEDGGFDGMAVLEYEADPANPVPALKRCVERMRALA